MICNDLRDVKARLSFGFILFLLTFSISTFASDGWPPARSLHLPKIRKFESYITVRENLLNDGWSPYHAPDAGICGDDRCTNRPEMLSCSSVEKAPCAWMWKKNNIYIVISTIYGVNSDVVTGVEKSSP
jgi:hypothetical protein